MEYIKVSATSEPAQCVHILCDEGKIDGVIRKGNLYVITADAEKLRGGRRTKPMFFE